MSDVEAQDRIAAPATAPSFRRSLTPHIGLFGLLTIATFFEGFDTALVGLVQPLLGREFLASTEELGLVLGVSSFGMVLAFFVIHLADWFGRRPVFLTALGVYALLTLATCLAPNLVVFTGLQLVARMAMVVELSLAYLILSEELPATIRGRANGLLGGFAAVGAAVPWALLAPLEALGFGWRGLFVMGAIPLLLFPLYVSRLRETRAYRSRRAAETGRGERRNPSDEESDSRRFDAAGEWRLLRDLFTRERSLRLLSITALWFTINFWSGTALGFFTIYAFGERGWDAGDLVWLPLGTIPFGFAGYALCGLAMDRLGRQGAATLYLVAAFVATACCYQSSSTLTIYMAWFVMIGVAGIWTITTTWTMELFPTRIRATALGVTANLFGRTGMVIGPILAGHLSTAWSSTANAITSLAALNLLCLPIVWWVLPETRDLDLAEPTDGSREPANQPLGS